MLVSLFSGETTALKATYIYVHWVGYGPEAWLAEPSPSFTSSFARSLLGACIIICSADATDETLRTSQFQA